MHERVRRAFLDIAEEEPDRCVVIDASQPEAMVAEDVWEIPDDIVVSHQEVSFRGLCPKCATAKQKAATKLKK